MLFSKAIIFRRRHQRNRRRIIGRRTPINNNTLSQLARLPFQITNNSLANQILNGSSFY